MGRFNGWTACPAPRSDQPPRTLRPATPIGLVPLATVMLSMISARRTFAHCHSDRQPYLLQALVPYNFACLVCTV